MQASLFHNTDLKLNSKYCCVLDSHPFYTVANNDFEALIAEKSSAKESLTVEIATLEENLTALKADLKAKKAELKKLDTELGKLEEQKAAFDAAEAEKAKKAELESVLQKLMADGVSAAEILEKLK